MLSKNIYYKIKLQFHTLGQSKEPLSVWPLSHSGSVLVWWERTRSSFPFTPVFMKELQNWSTHRAQQSEKMLCSQIWFDSLFNFTSEYPGVFSDFSSADMVMIFQISCSFIPNAKDI